MKKIQDKFSCQSKAYATYRPTYPESLYNEILSLVKERDACWDCGTGNGQVAAALSSHFTSVRATDISANQLSHAMKGDNIQYSVQRAATTNFSENQFDLITVAQAAHWFDMERFTKECKRVAKDGAVIALWGYGLLKIEKKIDVLIEQFYHEIVGPFWDLERKHVDNAYTSIHFDFPEIDLQTAHFIVVSWTKETLEGYFNSWSSVQNYKNEKGENPVAWIMERIKKHWETGTVKEIRFPIFTRIGRVRK